MHGRYCVFVEIEVMSAVFSIVFFVANLTTCRAGLRRSAVRMKSNESINQSMHHSRSCGAVCFVPREQLKAHARYCCTLVNSATFSLAKRIAESGYCVLHVFVYTVIRTAQPLLFSFSSRTPCSVRACCLRKLF